MLSSPSQVKPVMSQEGGTEGVRNTQGFDNPAFGENTDKREISDGQKAADGPHTNGNVPLAATYTNQNNGGVVASNGLPPKGDSGNTTDNNWNEAEKEKQAKRDKKPMKFIEIIVSNLGICFGIFLAMHIILLVTTGILMRIGYDILPIKFDRLPLDIRDDVDYLRQVAWAERNDEDNKIISRGSGGDDSYQEQRSIETEIFDMIFELEGGNVFTAENLKAIKEVEDKFMDVHDFKTKFCRLDNSTGTPVCNKPTSVIRFFDGSFAAIGLPADLEFTDIPRYLNTIQSIPRLRPTLAMFLGKDNTITPTEATSSATRSWIAIGGPLAGYTNTSHLEAEQETKYKEFFSQDFSFLSEGYFKNKVGPNKMNFFYYSQTIFSVTILNQVQVDMSLAIGSFLFIAIFMMIQTGSLWITFFSVFSIITCFLGANIVYRCILDFRYFGIFHVLALFIILGIGADDIFVFLDTWKESAHHKYISLAHRMSYVYRRASIAMLFTSVTTAIAFFISASSPFLGISSFGVFSGILILVNYISVILFFPCAVLMYHKYFEQYKCCCCCPRSVTPDGEAPRDGPKRKNIIVRFFRGPYYKFVTHKIARWCILGFFAALLGTFIYFASQLKVNEEQIKFFKESSNVAKYLDRNANAFNPASSDTNAKIYIVFGLKPQDLSSCHKTDPSCFGKTVWDEDFSLDSVAAQNDIKTLCDNLHELSAEMIDKLHIKRSVIDQVTPEVQCFMTDMIDTSFFKAGGYPDFPYEESDWNQLRADRSDVYSEALPTGFQQYFGVSLGYWMYEEFNGTIENRLKYSRFLGEVKDGTNTIEKTVSYGGGKTETVFYGTRLRYAAIVVNTTLEGSKLGYDEGLIIRDFWEEYVTGELNKMTEKENLNGFQTTFLLWHWLKVQRKLVSSAVTGIVIGLCVCLPILIIATHNVLVGLLATFIICCITVSVIGVIPAGGWKLGLLESLNLVLVVGLAVDYVVHLAEGYSRSPHTDRKGRVRDALEEVGISVLSGACTTLGASFFLMFATIVFFTQFGIFMFSTIGFSIVYSLGLFITLLGLIGPEGETGSLKPLYRKIAACCCKKKE